MRLGSCQGDWVTWWMATGVAEVSAGTEALSSHGPPADRRRSCLQTEEGEDSVLTFLSMTKNVTKKDRPLSA